MDTRRSSSTTPKFHGKFNSQEKQGKKSNTKKARQEEQHKESKK
jgi:hypothetical protein